MDATLVNVSLEEAIATNSPQRSTSTQLEETWEMATYSLGRFTVDLMQLGIWLMVYSPYWLLFGAAAFGYMQYRKHTARILPTIQQQESD